MVCPPLLIIIQQRPISQNKFPLVESYQSGDLSPVNLSTGVDACLCFPSVVIHVGICVCVCVNM